jgi:myo-inositol catabolism protein IolC
MPNGYDKPLYILPFDHRHSYLSKLFQWQEPLTAAETAEVAASKQIIYEGFKAAAANGVPLDRAGILVDEEFGSAILRDAVSHGVITCLPVEKSGQEEFEFEYGEDFERHIEEFSPTFAKALVRYNPEGNASNNKRQTEKLHRLSEYLARSHRLFMIELIVPPEQAQLAHLGGDQKARLAGDQDVYDRELRPKLMVETIRTLQGAGIEPDVWKVEGLDRREDCEKIVETARNYGREKVGCIVLGHGSDEQKVRSWLKTAASISGFIGFAVGRTTWWDAVAAWHEKKISRDEAIVQIAKRFQEWANIFDEAHRI